MLSPHTLKAIDYLAQRHGVQVPMKELLENCSIPSGSSTRVSNELKLVPEIDVEERSGCRQKLWFKFVEAGARFTDVTHANNGHDDIKATLRNGAVKHLTPLIKAYGPEAVKDAYSKAVDFIAT
jgi:hypothetical protein